MKTKALQLSIPEPCSQSWDDMKPTGEGRHCTSCNKTIIDFSLYSDRQLLEFIQKSKGQLCGRLSTGQVNRPIFYNEPQNHFLHKLLFGSALTIGIACSANANYNPNQKPLIEQYELIKNNFANEEPMGDSTKRVIEGVVKDTEVNSALPFVSVLLTYNGQDITSAITDMDGKFTLNIPLNLANEKMILHVSYPGYHDKKQELIPSQVKSNYDIYLKTRATVLQGALIISCGPPPAYDNTNGWEKQTLRKKDTPYW